MGTIWMGWIVVRRQDYRQRLCFNAWIVAALIGQRWAFESEISSFSNSKKTEVRPNPSRDACTSRIVLVPHAKMPLPLGLAAILPNNSRFVMRETGLEPARPCGHQALNLARLPIPPFPRMPFICAFQRVRQTGNTGVYSICNNRQGASATIEIAFASNLSTA